MSNKYVEDEPPAYSEEAPSSRRRDAAFPSYLESHLSNLPTLIRESQEAHATSQVASDLAFISLLTPHIERLLHKIASLPSPPALAELILVPSAPIAGWAFSGEKPGHGEKHQLVRVVDKEGLAKAHDRDSDSEPESSMSKSNPWQTKDEFDDWGRWGSEMDGGDKKKNPGDWWWNDEDHAVRLARHLQPRPPAKSEPKSQTPVPSTSPLASPPTPKRSGGKWSFFKSAEPVAPPPVLRESTPRNADDNNEEVTMSVKAEEVTFRRENEFGVFESRSGYGIVVRVRTKLGGRKKPI